jgi:arginase
VNCNTMPSLYDIEILTAPSILGLTPGGVQGLAESLLDAGLAASLGVTHPVVTVPTLNALYSDQRDPDTHCLNAPLIRQFSAGLGKAVTRTIRQHRFALVLGGDCSILTGIMPALKQAGNYGLVFLDAHADFYSPERSTTGQVADMDLAIVTGRGPELLTNMDNLRPYVPDEQVVHIGQRDWEETRRYGSPDIRDTPIRCFGIELIEQRGIAAVTTEVLQCIDALPVDGYWIHFDTDVLSDDINPAVDYRLPGGLSFEQAGYILHQLLLTGRMAGMSVTIYNPALDEKGSIAQGIVQCLGQAFDLGPKP